jgi:hypothetical protein
MRITIKKERIDNYLVTSAFSCLLFFYIYAPKLIYLPINFGYLSMLVGFFYFSIGSNITKLFVFFKSRIYLTFLYFYTICIIYTLLVLLFSTETDNYDFLITYLRFLLDLLFIIPFFIIFARDELYYDIDKFLKKLLIIGVVQGVIATLMIAVPHLKDIMFAYIFQLPSSKLLTQGYRGFGISSDFYFSTPLFQALIFAVNTKFYLEGGKKYLFYYPFILISMVLNARTSVVIIPILFIVIIIMSFYFDEFKWIRRLSGLMIALVALIIIVAIYLILNPDKMQIIIWVFNGFMGAVGALTGTGESVTFNNILLKQLHVPHQTSQILFGEGLVVFGNKKSPIESDLGYIRYIYYGGITLSLILYFNIYNFAKSCISLVSDRFLKIFLISITVMIFVTHMKGDVFGSSAFMKGVFLIQMFILYKKTDSATK